MNFYTFLKIIFLLFCFFSFQKDQLKIKINDLLKIQQILDHSLSASKLQSDDLTAKDQQLDRQFKTFFMEIVSTAVIDQAYRIFK